MVHSFLYVTMQCWPDNSVLWFLFNAIPFGGVLNLILPVMTPNTGETRLNQKELCKIIKHTLTERTDFKNSPCYPNFSLQTTLKATSGRSSRNERETPPFPSLPLSTEKSHTWKVESSSFTTS